MALDAREQKIVEVVDRVGWVVMKVSPNKGDPDPRWFAYTIGLSVTQRWPELICFGLRVDALAELVNNAVRELKRKGIAPSLDRELTEVIDGAPVRLGLFSKEFYREHLGLALWFAYHRSLNPESFGCLQMLWPDKRGHFPFEASCEPEVRRIQTPVNLDLA